MNHHTEPRIDVVPGIVTVAGGAITVIGCLLPWGRLSPGQSGLFAPVAHNAIEEPFELGWFALGAGIALTVCGVLLLFMNNWSWRRAIGEAAIVVSLVPIFVAGYNIATFDQKVDEVIRVGVEESIGRRLTDQELERFRAEIERIGIDVSLQFGVYLAILGGLGGVAGSLLTLRPGGSRERAGGGSGFEPSPPPIQAPTPPRQAPETWQVPEPGPPGGQGPEEDPAT
jgi:hypothetical protein